MTDEWRNIALEWEEAMLDIATTQTATEKALSVLKDATAVGDAARAAIRVSEARLVVAEAKVMVAQAALQLARIMRPSLTHDDAEVLVETKKAKVRALKTDAEDARANEMLTYKRKYMAAQKIKVINGTVWLASRLASK